MSKNPDSKLQPDRIRLSLAIITLNEARNIERCIRSVPFAEDVVVIDSGSTDETLEIAKRCGARVYVEPWRGFRDQKQFATDQCRFDWVLSLDADEALSSEAQQEIEKLLTSPNFALADGYEFPRLTWTLDRWIKHGGWYPDRQLRLFNRTSAKWRGGKHVHERVGAKKCVTLTHPIYHWPFPTHAEQVSTNNRYSSLGAKELYRRGKRFSLYLLLVKPISKFLESYVIKRGFLDGLPGLIIAVGASYSIFLKYAKLWEIETYKRNDRLRAKQNEKSS